MFFRMARFTCHRLTLFILIPSLNFLNPFQHFLLRFLSRQTCHYKLRYLPTNFVFSFIILLRCSLFFLILFLLFFSKNNNELNKWQEKNLKIWTLFDNNFLYFIISFCIYNFIIYLSILIDEFLMLFLIVFK